jgi:23S rRNA pseudouridine1911/1915/1917 synthase
VPDYRVGPAVDQAAGGAELDDPGPDIEFESRSQTIGPAGHGLRLDRALTQLVPEFSRSHLQGLIEAGHVRLDQATVKSSSAKVKAGQSLSVVLMPPAEVLAFRPEPIALEVVFEDEHIMVIDKPAGLVVHPAAGNWSGTLLNGVLARHPDASCLPRAGIVHRLDKDTSGLMVVGRSLAAVTALVRDIASREVRRRYRALAHGALQPGHFSVDQPIGRDPAVRVRMAVSSGGKPARTDVELCGVGHLISALVCTLHTGRTHQIRVHLSHIGHPLVADALYGGRPSLGLSRQALHAFELGFNHPVTREPLLFSSSPPADFDSAWEQVLAAAPELRKRSSVM